MSTTDIEVWINIVSILILGWAVTVSSKRLTEMNRRLIRLERKHDLPPRILVEMDAALTSGADISHVSRETSTTEPDPARLWWWEQPPEPPHEYGITALFDNPPAPLLDPYGTDGRSTDV